MTKLFRCLLFLSFTSCAYLGPLVQDFNIVSVQQEAQISEKVAAEVSQQMPIVSGQAVTEKVRSIGNRLVQALPHRDFNYQFYVVSDKSPNAFTIPGGKIYVHTGLLQLAQSDDEVAAVIAHEIGHAYQRHPAKALSRQYGIDALSQLLLRGKTTSQAKTLALKIAQSSVVTYYGREDEFEADEAGFYILRRSGMPTRGLISFFQKLQALEKGGGGIPSFLSTHPPTPERIARLQALEAGTRQPALVFKPYQTN